MNSRTRVKFCGMTRAEDIEAAVALGVDAVGIILYPKSSRSLPLSQAKEIAQSLSPMVSLVAVMVNPSRAEVEAAIEQLPLHYLQFHGNESADFCDAFNFPYFKAIQARDSCYILDQVQRYPKAEAMLLDTPSAQDFGGTGRCFDWSNVPQQCSKPIILAGGLSADSVAEAVRSVSPYALDLCSGIESQPGIKDIQKMQRFMHNLQKGAPYV